MSLLSPPLEAFIAIAQHKTVHAAAAQLGITQTGVTQRIRSLESQLSATLFTRSRRGMLLTSEGEALLRYCQAARDLEGEALAKIQNAGTLSAVRVCLVGPTSLLRTRVIPQCSAILKKYPELLLTFRLSDSESGADALKTGGSQLAVVPREGVAREMDSKLLKPERYVLVACKSWRKRTLTQIVQKERIIDFDAADAMTRNYLRKYQLLDHARADRHFVNNTESLAELIEAGLGYGVLTYEFAAPYLTAGRLTLLNDGKCIENELALAWYPRPETAGYWKALVAAIK